MITANRGRRARRGSVLLVSIAAVLALAGIAAAVFGFTFAHGREASFQLRELRALYVAEAGMAEAILAVTTAVDREEPVPAALGTEAAPRQLAGGRYTATIQDNGDLSYTVRVTGLSNAHGRTLEARLSPSGESAFDHAIFAGNSSGDPNYELAVGGQGGQADLITGDVYSGGGVRVWGDAEIEGEVRAAGAVSESSTATISTSSGVTRPPLDLAAMDYANNHDVDVAAIFAAEGYSKGNALGGTAVQVPEASPAHIFRRNPSDRKNETRGTAKDDYFLEDPYEPAKSFNAVFGKGHEITLAGVNGQPGPDSNEAVYYIDGNLWIHNAPFGGVRIDSAPDGSRVTFVVSGNLYISDDLLLDDEALDGLAFITLVDPAVPDSGNIYFGDPRWGTLELMHAYLYAENDFYDNNLDRKGSREVVVHGNMTAGNHVAIERDYVKPNGTVMHSRLEVDFDERVSAGTLNLPGIPDAVLGVGGLQVASWMEVGE